ncbi:hypothetical protein F3D3_1233 [Fusibacter sp. 3D3]|nr:hypothetical protein F3D3_1233 [Fusibacter sp. 3D3]
MRYLTFYNKYPQRIYVQKVVPFTDYFKSSKLEVATKL